MGHQIGWSLELPVGPVAHLHLWTGAARCGTNANVTRIPHVPDWSASDCYSYCWQLAPRQEPLRSRLSCTLRYVHVPCGGHGRLAVLQI